MRVEDKRKLLRNRCGLDLNANANVNFGYKTQNDKK